MPDIIACPHCGDKLTLPDGMLGKKVKCPLCATTFTAAAGPAKSRPANVVEEEVEEERPREASRRRARPRDDEDEEPPRSRRRRSRDDDDDYDDEPRARRRRRDDHEDDDDPEYTERQRARARAKQFKFARLGLLLNFIAACLYVGALGLAFLLLLINVTGGKLDYDLLSLAGLPGLANWIVAGVGFGFCLAGPRKKGALGLGIATAAVAGTHLIFMLVGISQGETLGPYGGRLRGFTDWLGMVTHLTYLGNFTAQARIGLEWIPLVAGLLELARLILFMLWLRILAQLVKEYSIGRGAIGVIIAIPSIVGVLILINLIFYLIAKNVTSIDGLKAIAIFALCINYLGLIGGLVWYMLVLMRARQEMYG